LVTTVEAAAQRPILLIAATLILMAAASGRQLDDLIYRIPDADLTVPHPSPDHRTRGHDSR